MVIVIKELNLTTQNIKTIVLLGLEIYFILHH